MIYRYTLEPTYKAIIDRNAFISQININKKKYSHIDGIEKYIDNWISAFFNSFNREKSKIFNFTQNRYYYTTIYVSGYELRIHFNIDKALALLNEYPLQRIPLCLFSNNSRQEAPIKYTEYTSNHKYRYDLCDIPVIIVQYVLDGFRYLLIDGNHRVTAKKLTNQYSVTGIVLTFEDSVSLIQSEFERALYTFFYEGSHINEYINDSNYKLFL